MYKILISGLYNVCSGKGYALKSVLELIAKLAAVSVEAVLDESLLRPSDNMVIVGDNSKLCAETGWKPAYSLEQTVKDMLKYSQRGCA